MRRHEATPLEMGRSIAGHGVRIISDALRNKETLVSEEEYQERLGACEACPLLMEGFRCRRCGCRMRLKAKFKISKCPEGKWNEEEIS